MKYILRVSLLVAMVAALFLGVSNASASLQTYNSGIQVQNLDAATTANITLIFYNADGSTALTATDSIGKNSSKTYFPLENIGAPGANVPNGFEGSAVIYSNTKVAAITNIAGSNGTDPLAYGASYTGFTGGSPTVSLPLLMKGNYGFSTWFMVQNTGGSATDVSVTYSDGKTASAPGLAAGASAKFDQATETHASGWVGSATVSGSGSTPLAITALEVGPTTLFAYDGFGAGASLPTMPLINENNYGYVTGVQVMNTGGSTTDVTITFTPGAGMPGTACTEKRHVAANQSISFALYVFTTFVDPAPSSLVSTTCTKGQTFVGAAKVTANSASTPLVAIVNQLNGGNNKGDSYGSFDPAAGTDTVVFPLIMDRNYGFFTGYNVVNVGGSTIAKADLTCTVTGKDLGGNPVTTSFNPPADVATGTGWNQVNLNTIANGFVGSAVCKGPTGSKLVGMVNELKNGTNTDTFYVYSGVNP